MQAEALIIELDTPGGLDTSMRSIVKDIIGSQVPVVVFVYIPPSLYGIDIFTGSRSPVFINDGFKPQEIVAVGSFTRVMTQAKRLSVF